MKTRNYLWVGVLCVFTSCVDSKYDLDKVNTDHVTLGDEWVIPLGVLNVKVTDVIDLDKNKIEGLQIAANGDYSISYKKETLISFPKMEKKGHMIDIASSMPAVDFNVNDLKGMMGAGDGFVLGLANPYITLVASGLEGSGAVDADLGIIAHEHNQPLAEINSSFQLSKAKPNVWIGPWPTEDASYSYVKNEGLPNLIAILPEKITAKISKFLFPVGEITNLQRLTYALELPFIPSREFRATTNQQLKDLFNEDLIKYVFSSGTTTIFGTITNQLPIDATITMSITDAQGTSLLKFPDQIVKGYGPQSVSFKIEEAEMPKMQTARNIHLKFALSGRSQDMTQQVKEGFLNEKQTLKMDLKLRKTGGINVSL